MQCWSLDLSQFKVLNKSLLFSDTTINMAILDWHGVNDKSDDFSHDFMKRSKEWWPFCDLNQTQKKIFLRWFMDNL